jgi:hypothetical protein
MGIGQTFDTVFLTDIPKLSLLDINETRRLISLIDALYDKKVKVIVTAAAAPEAIFSEKGDLQKAVDARAGGGDEGEDEDENLMGNINLRGDLLDDGKYVINQQRGWWLR